MDPNIVNIKCLSIIMVICIKQHLSNIWSSIHEKVKQHWGWVENKHCLLKKACITWVPSLDGLNTTPLKQIALKIFFLSYFKCYKLHTQLAFTCLKSIMETQSYVWNMSNANN